MGIKDLLPLIRSRQGHAVRKRYDTLRDAELGDRRIGVDISVDMHKFIVQESVVKAFHQQPPVCLQLFIDDHFDRMLKSYKDLNLIPVFVFDGRRHPLMANTNTEREDSRAVALREMHALLNQNNPNLLSDVVKKMTRATYVREDIIACTLDWARRKRVLCIGAPYEADWQLRQLELDGIIDAVVTVDSDLVAMGCSTFIYNWDRLSDDGNCNIIRKEDVLFLFELAELDFRHLCIFLGTDYISKARHRMNPERLLIWV